ncbi:MAG: hypothetical protein ACRDTT_02730 [Pseudonocardiaceae bacterium]
MKESAGKKKGRNTTGHPNRYLAGVLGEAAAAAGKTDTFLGERYRRLARRRGTNRAIVAVGRSLLVIIWHPLSDPGSPFTDLGPDFYDKRTDPERRTPAHIHQLEALGYKVTLEPAARLPRPDRGTSPQPGSAAPGPTPARPRHDFRIRAAPGAPRVASKHG